VRRELVTLYAVLLRNIDKAKLTILTYRVTCINALLVKHVTQYYNIFFTIHYSRLYFRFFTIIYILYFYLISAGIVPNLTATALFAGVLLSL
jgi:hypothetical protein